MEEGKKLDWATAETLAFGSLLCQGKRRQDSRPRALMSIKSNVLLSVF